MEYSIAAGGSGLLALLERITISEWAMIGGVVVLAFIFFGTTRKK